MGGAHVDVRDLFDYTCDVIKREKTFSHESMRLIGRLDRMHAQVSLGLPYEDYLKELGLSDDVYRKRLKAARVVAMYPRLWTMLAEGKTHLAQLAMLYSKITEANCDLVLEKLPGMSKRDLEILLAKVGADGSVSEAEARIEIRVTLTESELAVLKRAREVLSASGHVPNDSEVFAKALTQLVEAKDPVRKAERAMQRKERAARREAACQTSDQAAPAIEPRPTAPAPAPAPGPVSQRRPHIPAAVTHAVYLRDEGQCTEILPDGRRCPERTMVERDHLTLYCRGGEDSLGNMRLTCLH